MLGGDECIWSAWQPYLTSKNDIAGRYIKPHGSYLNAGSTPFRMFNSVVLVLLC